MFKRIYLSTKQITDFFNKTQTKIFYFTIPALLSLIGSALEGAGIIILFPLLKGVLTRDFSFVKNLPIMGRILANASFLDSPIDTFIFMVLAVFVLLLISSILRYWSIVSGSYQLRKFSDRLRRNIFNRYLTFGKLFFDQNNIGNLHNILVNYTNQIASEIKNLQQALNLIFSLIIYIFIMVFVDWRLTLLILFVLPIFSYCSKLIIRKIKKTSHSYALSSKNINENIYNILSCIPLVKLYSKEAKEKKDFERMSDGLFRLEFSLDKKRGVLYPIREGTLLILALLLVSAISFILLKEKSGSISKFLVFFYLAKQASANFFILSYTKASLATISGQISAIMEIFYDKDKSFIKGGSVQFKGLSNNIELRGLNFSYTKNIQVLKGMSFFIEKEKATAIVGPSGAGKTTIINLILRFYECPPASIFVDGRDIKEFSLESLRKHIAIVSQDTLLFNDSIRNNIIYGLDNVSEKELVEVAKKARIYDYIIKLPEKFNTYIGDKGVKLSGGEKQRVAIARALLKKAEILILDEATSSLDSCTEKLIQEAINEIMRGRTTIAIAHRLSTIKNVDKILVIEKGTLIEQGSLNELLEKRGAFYQYWEHQKFY